MSTQPTNVQNVAGYLGYVSRAYYQGTLSETDSAIGTYPITAFTGSNGVNIPASRQNVEGWNFGLLDVATSSQPYVSYNVTENYLTQNISVSTSGYLGFNASESLGINFNSQVKTLLNSPPPQGYADPSQSIVPQSVDSYLTFANTEFSTMTLSNIYDFYQTYPYNPTTYNDPSFWANNPDAAKFKAFWDIINALTSTPTYNSQGVVQNAQFDVDPPTNFTDVYNAISKLQIYDGTSNPPAALVQTQNPPSFVNTNLNSPGLLLNTVFATYVQTYESNINSLIAGQTDPATGLPITNPDSIAAFATGWYRYLQQPYTGAGFVSPTIPIYLSVADQPGTLIPTGDTVPVPDASTGVTLISSSSPPVSQATFVKNFEDNFLTDFSGQLQQTTAWANADLTNGESTETLLNNNFQLFMNYMVAQGGSSSISSYDSWIQQWEGFVGPVSLLSNPTSSSSPTSQSLLTYQKIYDTFYPSGTSENGKFMTHLSSFINGFLSSPTAAFNPSLMVDQWFTKLVNHAYSDAAPLSSVSVKLDDADYASVRILNQVYRGLASMVQTIQQLTVAQADRLNFYTSLQQAYTKTINTIPVVVRGIAPTYLGYADPNNPSGTIGFSNVPTTTSGPNPVISDSPINGSDPNDVAQRAEFNAMSGQFVSNMEDLRSEISDRGNAYQAAVNNSNQAVNAEVSVATEILQAVAALAQYVTQTQPPGSQTVG